jgi:mannitol/fructose-specific phosphotransferase system IIA component (Ntr-type)
MKNYKITLTITAENEEQATQIASKLQSAAKKVDGNTLAKMLVKLEKNPQWISLATKFC